MWWLTAHQHQPWTCHHLSMYSGLMSDPMPLYCKGQLTCCPMTSKLCDLGSSTRGVTFHLLTLSQTQGAKVIFKLINCQSDKNQKKPWRSKESPEESFISKMSMLHTTSKTQGVINANCQLSNLVYCKC